VNERELLREIRDNFTYCVDAWRSIREEAAIDMRYVSGDPWDPKERQARKELDRPCIALDELGQYTNQLINDVRQNKRSIKLIPGGNGASEKTAEFKGNMIRGIEYKSKAQSAYCTAYEALIQRSYGHFRIGKQYVSPDSFDQEITIKRIPNPDTVYIDPDHTERDASDMNYAFVLERFRHDEFKRKWPKARITDFSAEIISEASPWISEKDIQVAEYWKVHKEPRTLLLLDDGSPRGLKLYQDELPDGSDVRKDAVLVEGMQFPLLNRRQSEQRRVAQYITNGVEVLETNKWDGKYIPLVCMFGKELYVDQGAGPKRKLLSLVRLARDPYMLYCYYRTCQAELVGLAPKTVWVGYEGQFENHEEEWANVNKSPIPYLQIKAITDATGAQTLPPPQRQVFEPPIQALELGAESARRAIQAACGMYNSSVGKQDTSARSGVAIKALDLQSDQGNFHFVDAYDGALEHAGRIIDDLLDKVYDTPRDHGLVKPDETHELVRINEPYQDPRSGAQVHYRTDEGDHDVTVTTGPSYQSQRDEAAQFADALANTPLFPRVADLIVKMRNLGPLGDEMAKRLTPPDIAQQQQGQQEIPPQFQQQLQQLSQELQALNQYAQQQEKEIQQYKAGLQAKQMEVQSREKIAELQVQADLVKTQAQIDAKNGLAALQADIARIEAMLNRVSQQDSQAAQLDHEAQQADAERMHQQQMQSQQQAAADQAQMQPLNSNEMEQMKTALQPEPGPGEESGLG
jgi:hypothetical protein